MLALGLGVKFGWDSHLRFYFECGLESVLGMGLWRVSPGFGVRVWIKVGVKIEIRVTVRAGFWAGCGLVSVTFRVCFESELGSSLGLGFKRVWGCVGVRVGDGDEHLANVSCG